MIDREHQLSIAKQAEILKISRGRVYYPRPASSADLTIMRQLDRLHLEFPLAGSRCAACWLRRVHDRPPSCEDADSADGDKSAVSPSAHHQARAWPHDPSVSAARLEIAHPNQVWAMDITCIPMAQGIIYLAVVCWTERHVLSWWLSITMEAAFCVETLDDALTRHGKGAWRDNVFVERLWKSVKYEEVYRARSSIGRYLDFYTYRRGDSVQTTRISSNQDLEA